MSNTSRRQPAGHVLIAGVVGLLVASVLNAHSLAEVAERQEPGVGRTVATALTGPLERASSALWLDRPRAAIDALLGRGTDEPSEPVRAAAPAPTVEPSEPVALAPRVTPTAADPADAWIIGDSFVELFGPKLSGELFATGVVEPEVDFRFITGLSRPDAFDWPSHIRERMRTAPPDIVVVMFGGNDAQPVSHDGEDLAVDDPRWWDLYRTRVAEALDAIGPGPTVYWVGLPVMKDPDFSARATELNAVYREAVAEHASARYVSSWEVFTGPDGNYADYLPNLNGDMRLMRYEDGAHFTPSGALRLALHVYDVIASDWSLEQDEVD